MTTGHQAGLRVRVARKLPLAVDIALFELVSVDGASLPAFSAGAHIDVSMPGGHTRQYSLCNDPARAQRYEIAVLKDPQGRGGSVAMHEQVQQGDELSISHPRNHFELASGAQESVLLAGGIGITPLLCMAQSLAASGQSFVLHYCSRSEGRTAFRERLAHAPFADRVRFHFDDGPASQALDLAGILGKPRPRVHLYTCGPQGFMDAVLSSARGSGWAQEQLHYEFFKAEPAPSAGTGFEVLIASSGRVIRIEPDQTVVAALAAHGIEVPTSCEQGVCGTCMTGVLDGEPEHRDLYLSPQEQASNDQFLPCCSRAKSARLVLDL